MFNNFLLLDFRLANYPFIFSNINLFSKLTGLDFEILNCEKKYLEGSC